VSTADQPIGDDELGALFEGLETLPGLVIAVSGGPDSTALLVLAARWAKRLGRSAPRLLAATVDHGLRRQSAAEAAAVRALARRLGVSHRTLRWRGKKPQSGLQEAARAARYGLLAQAARRAGYAHILTGHTLDDQAETVLLRLTRGSGLAGLRGMASPTPLPFAAGGKMLLVRPFLAIAKSRLVATLQAAAIAYSDDPSNLDPRFTRAPANSTSSTAKPSNAALFTVPTFRMISFTFDFQLPGEKRRSISSVACGMMQSTPW
jgi:tRNA(Ile)-lysidine synthase